MLQGTITFSKDVSKMMDKIEERTRNLTPVMQRAAAILAGDSMRHFNRQEGSVGKWTPLKNKTKKWKSKIGKTQPLVLSGRMRQSNIPSWGKKFAALETSLLIENKTSYAPYHHYGTKDLPKREWIWVKRGEMDRYAAMVLDYIAEVRI